MAESQITLTYFSIDVLWDILLALPRDETEKCQLVNRKWNNVILSRKPILPFRKFTSISFGNNPNVVKINFEKALDINKEDSILYFEAFKYCVFEKYLFDNSNSLETNNKLIKICGKKILAIAFPIHPNYMHLVPTILNEFLIVDECIINSTYNLEYILDDLFNPSILKDIASKCLLSIESIEFPYIQSNFENTIEFIINAEALLGKNMRRMDFASFNFEAFKQIIEKFDCTNKPECFLKCINFHFSPNTHEPEDEAPMIMSKVWKLLMSKAKNTTRKKYMHTVQHYVLKREDGWKLNISMFSSPIKVYNYDRTTYEQNNCYKFKLFIEKS